MNDDSRVNRLILSLLLVGVVNALLTGSWSYLIAMIAGILVAVLVCQRLF
jgi:predicted branched-subunit amino acid permease